MDDGWWLVELDYKYSEFTDTTMDGCPFVFGLPSFLAILYKPNFHWNKSGVIWDCLLPTKTVIAHWLLVFV